MRRLLTFIKYMLHTAFILAAVVAAVLYVAVHYNLTGMLVEDQLIAKLSGKINSRVEIGEIEVNWLNQVALNHIVIYDQQDDTLLYARRAMVAYEFVPLLRQKLVLNTIQLIGFELSVHRDTLGATANYEFLVEALAPRQKNRQRRFINDATINALLLRQGTVRYDVLDQPHTGMRLLPDPNHIRLSNISASLKVDVSHVSGLDVVLKRITLDESSGLRLHEGHGWLDNSDATVCLDRLTLSDDDYADIDLSLRTDLDLNAPDSFRLDARIHPSTLSRQALSDVCTMWGKTLDGDLQTLSQRISQLTLDGHVVARGMDNIDVQANVGTTGQLIARFAATASYTGKVESASAKGTFHRLPYLGHTYTNVSLDARYVPGKVFSRLAIGDPLCRMSGSADVTMSDTSTQVSATLDISRILPHELNLTSWKNAELIAASGRVSGTLDIDRKKSAATSDMLSMLPIGSLRIDSLMLTKPGDTLRLDPLRLNVQREQGTKVAVVASPVINVVATPSVVMGNIPAKPELTRMLGYDFELGETADFMAEWDSIGDNIQIALNVPRLRRGEADIRLAVNANGTTRHGQPLPDYLTTRLNLDYATAKHHLTTNLRAAVEPEPLFVKMEPSVITIDGREFQTTGAQLVQEDDGGYVLQDMMINDNEEHLAISGTLSAARRLDLNASLQHFKTDFFFDMLNKQYLDFGGFATGMLTVSSDSVLHLATDSLVLDDFTYIGYPMGRHVVSCFYDLDNSRLLLNTDIHTDSLHFTHTDCDIMMGDVDSLDLRFRTDSLPVDFVSHWVGDVLQDMHGFASGDVRLYGKFSDLNITGRPMLHNVNFTHSLLGSRFSVSDTLFMDVDETSGQGYIGIRNTSVLDPNGQQAIATADVMHTGFSNIEYGVDIELPETPGGFLIFDHPQQLQNELYWGRLWATGRCQMHGANSRHKINLQMATAGRSVFYLSPGEENFSEGQYNFLTFRDKRYVHLEDSTLLKLTLAANDRRNDTRSYIDADLMINANEHCQVMVQLDPLADDRLTCKGTGDLALHYDPYHDITLTGNYDITSGSYTVNMKGDLMTKAFALQNGSRVTFSGIPSEAELNLNAVYNVPSANLRDLDESFASLSSMSRTTLPVDCKLLVTGQITAPQIAFDLEVKNTSDDVQALVHNIIGTQEMLNREVFYLLLFSKFYTPEYASTSQRQTGSELTSFASSSLTSQLNNMLGHLSDNFTLGTNFRSDKGDFSDMEMDLSLSTRLLNDRLLLNGNLGYRDPANRIGMTNTNNSFIGDFDMEVLVNQSGSVRAKFYSHYNDRDYSVNNALTTQGVGIVLRKDFRRLRELFTRKSKKPNNKKTQP
ncbi:MAG: translocation/assembly module TamB domain-containing protein [Bacteroidales bacterium]|nr:translocation/assembly module TamB domain-containing protein [Candidatus Liminaster caballi]